MRGFARVFVALVVLPMIFLVLIAAGCGGSSSSATPTHATAVFFDGINNGDARQTCSVSDLPHGTTVADCVAYYVQLDAQLSFFGSLGSYHVVAHSAKVWTQTYRGHTLEFATVKVYSTVDKSVFLTVHLRDRGHGWKIWYVS